MKLTAFIATVLAVLAAGCNGTESVQPRRDFPVIAKAQSGGTVVYLSEARRTGRWIRLVFRYREAEKPLRRHSIACAEITGGFETEFDETTRDGWVVLKCRTDYPMEARELGFVLTMCEERECEKADVLLGAKLPALGEVSKPGVSGRAGQAQFAVERIASLKGTANPQLDGKPCSRDYIIPYGGKCVTVTPGNENVLVVICKVEFPGAIPDVPRGFSEWDQVIVATGRGEWLGGAKSASDVENSRCFALVSVGREHMPREIKAYFFSAASLAALRREFAFAGLPNPRE
jgi:hypothetical protein